MSDSFWELAIVASDAPAAAIRHRGKVTPLGTGNLPELIAKAAERTPTTEPATLVLVHPRSMTVEVIGGWFAMLSELGVHSGTVRTVADTEVLATARFGEGDSREVIVGDVFSGEVYGRRGATAGPHEPLAVAMPRMVTEAGALKTWPVLVGNETGFQRYMPQLEGSHIRPAACTTEMLAVGALDPDRLRTMMGMESRRRAERRAARQDAAPARSKSPWRWSLWRPIVAALAVLVALVGVIVALDGFEGSDPDATVDEVLGPAAGGGDAGDAGAAGDDASGRDPATVPAAAGPETRSAPEPVAQGADIPSAVGYYFDLFDPVSLFSSLNNCFDTEGRKYEKLSFHCAGRGRELNDFAAANGLPELARPDAHVSIHFDTRSTLPRPLPHHHECLIDYAYPRDDAVDGAWVEVSEPCDPDDERYEGPWPEDEQADITIHDVRYVYETDEGEYHPVIRILGLKDLAAVDATLKHLGVVK